MLFYEADSPSEGSNTHFWASSIIVENGGELSAYGNDQPNNAFGFNGGILTIHLYGKNEAEWDPITQRFVQQNQGALCKSQTAGPCGIPLKTSDGKDLWAKEPLINLRIMAYCAFDSRATVWTGS